MTGAVRSEALWQARCALAHHIDAERSIQGLNEHESQLLAEQCAKVFRSMNVAVEIEDGRSFAELSGAEKKVASAYIMRRRGLGHRAMLALALAGLEGDGFWGGKT